VGHPQPTRRLPSGRVAFPHVDLLRRYTRLLLIRFRARRGARLHLHDVSRLNGRVWPTDIDELRHMNNGVYLSLLDHARIDLLLRSGAWQKLRAGGVYPVVTTQTITYRRSLRVWQRFVIESRIVGYDERAVFVEQRFVVDGEIWARAFVSGRFLRDRGGAVPMGEIGELTGVDVTELPAADWMLRWSADTALPSTKAPARSDW